MHIHPQQCIILNLLPHRLTIIIIIMYSSYYNYMQSAFMSFTFIMKFCACNDLTNWANWLRINENSTCSLSPTSSSSSHKYNTLKQLPIIYSVFILRHHYQHSSCEVFWIQCTYHMSQTWTGCKNNPFNGVNISCQVPTIPTTYTCRVTHCWQTHSH